jgi:predicted nucleic acid-binding protein
MKDRVFFDTNLIVYLYSVDELEKSKIVKSLMKNSEPVISTQVINEFSNVSLKKYKQEIDDVINAIAELEDNFEIVLTGFEDIKKALSLKKKYFFSYYDSLIIASAVLYKCNILYTEYLANNQVIENNIKIINPFKK